MIREREALTEAFPVVPIDGETTALAARGMAPLASYRPGAHRLPVADLLRGTIAEARAAVDAG